MGSGVETGLGKHPSLGPLSDKYGNVLYPPSLRRCTSSWAELAGGVWREQGGPDPRGSTQRRQQIRAPRIGAQGASGQRGPDDNAAVGDSWTVPAGPVVSVHASVLKPDVADAGRVIGERV